MGFEIRTDMGFEKKRRVKMILRLLVRESREGVTVNWNRKASKWNNLGVRERVNQEYNFRFLCVDDY